MVFGRNVTFRLAGSFSSLVCNQNITLVNGKTNTVNIGGTNRQMELFGTVYYDSISNCKKDSLDPRGNEHMVYVEPGDYSTLTNSKGEWNMKVPAGNYNVFYKVTKICLSLNVQKQT